MIKKSENKKKKRPKKYQDKLFIDGSLDDVLKVSVPKKKEGKKED